MSEKLRIAVCGATGYTGFELVRLLLNHPKVELAALTSQQSAGKKMSEVLRSVAGRCEIVLEKLDPKALAKKADFAFLALPHGEAAETAAALLEAGLKVVDLSADFRIHDLAVYEKTYEHHKAPNYLKEAVYGLPELHREKIKKARLVANPGCYPTATILALAPLLKNGAVSHDGLIADAKSGVSGAGRKADLAFSFSEVENGIKAYGVFTHRHTPEIEQELSGAAGAPIKITFTPHLIPMNRGILSTVYARAKNGLSTADLSALYRRFYEGEPFVRVLPEGVPPRTQDVAGSNYCDVSPIGAGDGRVICLSAIDNLVKGASGQAMQNMNLMMGYPETAGLEGFAAVP
ncbi:MAG: N-acetyl-gamma-glutamyl-phosphate reductase [Bdellovibrionota bacterium]